ncbi:MAG: hypothetical protein K6T35_04155 [Meiothermus silvanus]|nr:hypothetical protein [Allomeiothermus silvanus]
MEQTSPFPQTPNATLTPQQLTEMATHPDRGVAQHPSLAQPSVAEQARSALAKRLEQEVECER